MNPAAEKMLGYSPQERGLPINERLARLRLETADGKPFPLEETPPLKALRGETVQGVVMVLHPQGKDAIWVSITLTALVPRWPAVRRGYDWNRHHIPASSPTAARQIHTGHLHGLRTP